MIITEMSENDFKAFWPTFKEVVEAQETYAFDANLSYEAAKHIWLDAPLYTFVAKEDDTLLGSYYIKKNAAGPSSHISNCGYMVTPNSRGKGVASKMCTHSQDVAIKNGFSAMQFNSVVSTNKIAVSLWKKHGYKIVGTIPNAYKQSKLGLVDSFIMYKALKAQQHG